MQILNLKFKDLKISLAQCLHCVSYFKTFRFFSKYFLIAIEWHHFLSFLSFLQPLPLAPPSNPSFQPFPLAPPSSNPSHNLTVKLKGFSLLVVIHTWILFLTSLFERYKISLLFSGVSPGNLGAIKLKAVFFPQSPSCQDYRSAQPSKTAKLTGLGGSCSHRQVGILTCCASIQNRL